MPLLLPPAVGPAPVALGAGWTHSALQLRQIRLGAATQIAGRWHLSRARHELVCLVPAWDPSGCLCLAGVAEPPIHILRVLIYNYHQISCSGHSCFVLELVAGTDQWSDAYVGQLVSQPLRTA